MRAPLTVRAVLMAKAGEKVEGTTVIVNRFLLSGSAQPIGTGTADAQGRVSILCDWIPTGDYQPRLQLFLAGGKESARVLTETVSLFRGNLADFGSVPLTPTPTPTPTPIPKPAPVPLTPREASVGNVLEDIGSRFQRVQAVLRTSGSGYRIGNASLLLKVLPGAGDGGLKLAGAEEIAKVGAEGLSTLSVDLNAGEERGAGAEPLKVPPLEGYTEAFARRKLGASQLQAVITWQLVDKDEDVGRVVLQRPAAGTQVKPRDTIIIAIGRKD